MGKVVIKSFDELNELKGEILGVSDYYEITQEQINLFADATNDHQWIHVDVERAKTESPFGNTIAHVVTVEYQKRGLPHIHVLLWMDKYSKPRPEDFDRYVSAEIPDPIQEPDLHVLVMENMIHGPCSTVSRERHLFGLSGEKNLFAKNSTIRFFKYSSFL